MFAYPRLTSGSFRIRHPSDTPLAWRQHAKPALVRKAFKPKVRRTNIRFDPLPICDTIRRRVEAQPGCREVPKISQDWNTDKNE
jgi:hypothetical protein